MGWLWVDFGRPRSETLMNLKSPSADSLDRVAVFGHFGRGNLGDEATLAEVLRNIRLRQGEAQIRVFTINTADAGERHKATAFPIRRLAKAKVETTGGGQSQKGADIDAAGGRSERLRTIIKSMPVVAPVLRAARDAGQAVGNCVAEVLFLSKSLGRLHGTELFIIAGGGQLGDYFEGAWGYPYTIAKWTLLARLRGAQIAFVSAGAGPVTTALGRSFLGWSLSRAKYCSFRDEHSRRLIEDLGMSKNNVVFPDMVHGTPRPKAIASARESIDVVGINPLPFRDPRYWAEDDPTIYQRYVQHHADFSAWLVESGRRVVFIPTQLRADPPVIDDIIELAKRRLSRELHGSLMSPSIDSFDDLFSAIEDTDAMVASRFHGIVFSLLMGRPTLALSYDPKSADLMNDVGLRDFVKVIEQVDARWLITTFQQLCASGEEIKDRIEQRVAEYRELLKVQYDDLLGASSTSVKESDLGFRVDAKTGL